MIITVIIALIYGGPMNGDASSATGFKWSGFPVMFASTAVALTMHYKYFILFY